MQHRAKQAKSSRTAQHPWTFRPEDLAGDGQDSSSLRDWKAGSVFSTMLLPENKAKGGTSLFMFALAFF